MLFLLAGKRGGGKIAPRLTSRSPAMRVSQSVSEIFLSVNIGVKTQRGNAKRSQCVEKKTLIPQVTRR